MFFQKIGESVFDPQVNFTWPRFPHPDVSSCWCQLWKIFMSNFIRICRTEYDQSPGITKSVVGASGTSFI